MGGFEHLDRATVGGGEGRPGLAELSSLQSSNMDCLTCIPSESHSVLTSSCWAMTVGGADSRGSGREVSRKNGGRATVGGGEGRPGLAEQESVAIVAARELER